MGDPHKVKKIKKRAHERVVRRRLPPASRAPGSGAVRSRVQRFLYLYLSFKNLDVLWSDVSAADVAIEERRLVIWSKMLEERLSLDPHQSLVALTHGGAAYFLVV